MKVVIVGGVAGGASAAARLRRLNEEAEIIIFEKTGYISYATCGLPYYIGDVIDDGSKLTLQTPESFFKRFNIKVNVNHEVLEIDKERRVVKVKNLFTNQEFFETYDKLILSPGSKPIVPSFYKKSDKVFTVRTVEDTYKIKRYLEENNVRNASIIGGGYIGIEMAENLRKLGLDVNLIELNSQVLSILDKDMVSFVQNDLRNNGVNLYLGNKVKDIDILEDGVNVLLENNSYIKSDIVIIAIGVTPDTKLALDCGLKLGLRGSIIVDKHMRTSDENIYAVGDAIEVENFITKDKTLIPLAGPASKQGRIASDNICGINSKYNGTMGTSILKVFDMVVASVGISEMICKRDNIKYEKVILSPLSHAGYYPGASTITIKVIYEKQTLKILGAQIIGNDGVDKRIDVIATAIKANMKATNLKELELAYAPPFSQAKDPINLAGFIIENIENGLVKQFNYDDLENLRKREDVILLDTRTVFEFNNGNAFGFRNIPLDDLRNRINELDKNKKIYVMCQSGLRSYIATRILNQYGFEAYNFIGGYRLYNSIYKNENFK